MADKINMEEFDSTEIDIEEVKKLDKNDDWEFVSQFEADTYSVPFIRVPKMHEVVEEIGPITCETTIESDNQSEQGEFSPHETETRRKYEVEKALLPESQKLIDGVRKDNSFQPDQEQKREKIGQEIYEAMQDISLQHRQGQEHVNVVGITDESTQDELQNYHESDTVRAKIDDAMQDEPQDKQESDTIRINVSESTQQDERENERVKKAMDEALNEITIQQKQEQSNESLASYSQPYETNVQKNPISTEEFQLRLDSSAASFQETTREIICGKDSTGTPENTCTQSLAGCEKSQIPTAEYEFPVKAEKQVVQREFTETFQKILEFNTVVPEKVSTDTVKVVMLE